MNLVNGKLVSNEESDMILESLEKMITETLKKPSLDINLVLNACDKLIDNVKDLNLTSKFLELGINIHLAKMYIDQLEQILSSKTLRKRLEKELGEIYDKENTITYSYSKKEAIQIIVPLGVLFHITAGNVDGLPFMSILDGLLTGNINIVKLPKEERGITVLLLQEIIKIEPILSEYVYVFEYSSKDIYALKKLAAVSNAIIVWGSDETIKAVRTFALPNTKIIEWGHKISFAYVTKKGFQKESFEKLAKNICLTEQVFCSSCQGIYLDTDNMQDLYDFSRMFLPILEQVSKEYPQYFTPETKLYIDAKTSLELYHFQIENCMIEDRIFKSENCSIIASSNKKLEPSIMYRNIWVKMLQKHEIINLHTYKNYLQTAALICGEDEYDELAQALIKAGIVKVSDGFEMSNFAFYESHDGIFPLRCYSRIVSIQKNYPKG